MHWPATQQMDVQVVDGLPAVRPGVDHQPVSPVESFFVQERLRRPPRADVRAGRYRRQRLRRAS